MGTADGSNCGMIFYEADQNSHGEAFLFRMTVLVAVFGTAKVCRQTAQNEKSGFKSNI